MATSDCSAARALFGAYLLEGTTAEESAAVAGHIAACRRCNRMLKRDRRRLRSVPALEGLYEPPGWLKQRVMARLFTAAPKPARRQALVEVLEDFSPRLHPLRALTVGLSMLAVTFVGWNTYHTYQSNILADHNRRLSNTVQDAIAMATDPKVETVAFRGSAAAPFTEGSLMLHPEHRRGVILVHHLSPPQEGEVFQLWLWDPRMGVLLPAGTYRTLPEGIGVWKFQPPITGSTPFFFGVTREPVGGSEAPTSPMLFSGELPPQPEIVYPDDGVFR